MAAEIICDGCGKRAPAVARTDWSCLMPDAWFHRSDGDVIQTACSLECIEAIAKKTGKTPLVLPV